MSFTIHKKLRESLAVIRKPSYTSSHIAVLECLAYRINDKTLTCFPSEATIADESYLSERHVRKLLKELEQDGVVGVARSPRRTSLYSLNLPSDEVLINGQKTLINQGTQGVASTAIQGETVASDNRGVTPENRDAAAEARLTNNSNQSSVTQSLESIRDLTSVVSIKETAPSEHSTLSGEEVGTGFPVQGSNAKSAADPELLKLHSLLMKQIGSECPTPSAKDVKDLTKAIQQYGLGELYRAVEAIFKQKNSWWRKEIKKKNYPCSFLVSSLPTIIGQLESDEDSRRSWAQRKRVTEVSVTVGQKDVRENGVVADSGEDDFAEFNIDEDELDS